MTTNKPNGLKAWLLAIRPKTLTGAAAPVLIALAIAWSDASFSTEHSGASNEANVWGTSLPYTFQWIPALLCLLFALLMQIDANLINDYFDCIKGVDGEERLGPKRACAQGWITLPAMKRGIILTTLLSLAVGLPTIIWGGTMLIVVGVLCVIFAFLYTTLLSRLAMGDLLVIIFFGLVPVCVTYYVQAHCITTYVLWLSLAMGLVTDTLLIVNNYRDRETDKQVGKNTLVVFTGARVAEWLYLLLGLVAVALCQYGWMVEHKWAAILPLMFLLPHFFVWRKMVRIHQGRELNMVLGKTALCIFLFSLLVSIGILL